MRDKIKCGVIGAGWWATFAHIPALLRHPDAELVGIQSDDLQEAQNIAHDFGVPHACTTIEELLDLDDLSAVVVSSSPHLHYRDASAALSHGMHVLVEKPITLTASEAIHLVKLAHERGLRFLLSCPWHYTAHAAEARRMIADGALGELRMTSILMTNPVDGLLRGSDMQPTHGTPYMKPRPGTYSDPEIAGGGQIYAQVSHAAAYLAFLTGARATEIFARFHNDGAKLDIYDSLAMRMDDGSIVTIASTGATSLDRKDFEVRIFGTKGILFLDLWRGKLEFVPRFGPPQPFPDLKQDEVYPHHAPAWNLIDSIRDPSLDRAPATLGIAAMEVIEGACLSAESGNNIRVSSLVEKSV